MLAEAVEVGEVLLALGLLLAVPVEAEIPLVQMRAQQEDYLAILCGAGQLRDPTQVQEALLTV
jgi:hypothetical protein